MKKLFLLFAIAGCVATLSFAQNAPVSNAVDRVIDSDQSVQVETTVKKSCSSAEIKSCHKKDGSASASTEANAGSAGKSCCAKSASAEAKKSCSSASAEAKAGCCSKAKTEAKSDTKESSPRKRDARNNPTGK